MFKVTVTAWRTYLCASAFDRLGSVNPIGSANLASEFWPAGGRASSATPTPGAISRGARAYRPAVVSFSLSLVDCQHFVLAVQKRASGKRQGLVTGVGTRHSKLTRSWRNIALSLMTRVQSFSTVATGRLRIISDWRLTFSAFYLEVFVADFISRRKRSYSLKQGAHLAM